MGAAIHFIGPMPFFTVLAMTSSVFVSPPKVESLDDRVEKVTFHSVALNRQMAFCFVLPADYASNRNDWPVLFVLHGRGRHEQSLLEDKQTRTVLLDAPFVTVMPRGEDGWYIDSPAIPDDLYESYLGELITIATRLYRISSLRSKRGISGWSMGGYGCVRYAQRHPTEFSILMPVIGLLDFPKAGLSNEQIYSVPIGRFTDDTELWHQYNPLHQAGALEGAATCIVTADKAFDRIMNENYAAKLDDLSIDYTWHLLRGGHTFEIVRQAVPILVQFMSSHLVADQD